MTILTEQFLPIIIQKVIHSILYSFLEEISSKETVNEWPIFCKVLSKDWENFEILIYISKILFLKASWSQSYPIPGSL